MTFLDKHLKKDELADEFDKFLDFEKGTLYEQAKTALKKFKDKKVGGDKGVNAAIKLEPSFLAQHEQALLAAGYMKG